MRATPGIQEQISLFFFFLSFIHDERIYEICRMHETGGISASIG